MLLVIKQFSFFTPQAKDLSFCVDPAFLDQSNTQLQPREQPCYHSRRPRSVIHVYLYHSRDDEICMFGVGGRPLYFPSFVFYCSSSRFEWDTFLSEPEKDLLATRELYPVTREVEMISVPRDFPADPPGWPRLNSATSTGFSGSRNVDISTSTEPSAGMSILLSHETGMRPNRNFRLHLSVLRIFSDRGSIPIVKSTPLTSLLEYRILHAPVLRS